MKNPNSLDKKNNKNSYLFAIKVIQNKRKIRKKCLKNYIYQIYVRLKFIVPGNIAKKRKVNIFSGNIFFYTTIFYENQCFATIGISNGGTCTATYATLKSEPKYSAAILHK